MWTIQELAQSKPIDFTGVTIPAGDWFFVWTFDVTPPECGYYDRAGVLVQKWQREDDEWVEVHLTPHS